RKHNNIAASSPSAPVRCRRRRVCVPPHRRFRRASSGSPPPRGSSPHISPPVFPPPRRHPWTRAAPAPLPCRFSYPRTPLPGALVPTPPWCLPPSSSHVSAPPPLGTHAILRRYRTPIQG
ncbi:hypothetical protein U9M48_012518, partial [Paspalum notatum var. saurae]